jgi:predicted metalloprotease with PDZ domain
MSGLAYRVDVPAPHEHLIDVTVTVPAAALGDEIDLALPAWCPGSYLIRDYARFVRDLVVTGDDGAPRAATKVDKSTWRVSRGGATTLTARYRVYGHDLSVRTNHVDASHAFLHGPATFLYVEALRAQPVTVDVVVPAGWRLSSGLARAEAAADPFGAGTGSVRLTARGIDELFDGPIHLGAGEHRRFTAGGVPVELVVWGDRVPGGAFTLDDLVRDLTAIVDDHVARFAVAPFPAYTFVLMLSDGAYGGLEHRTSSINLHNPRALAVRKEYEGLLELLSHELFHAWNGKRIAPPRLLDFDYGREAYTKCLWVVEGVTSHYDRWALRSSQRITAKSYLEKVLDDWSRLLATPGRKRQSLEASSFDAWIKLYKPDESNLNTTVSYYLKGGLVLTALDLEIRRRTEGARSLDDVMRALWRDHGAPERGYPEDLQPIFEAAVGLDLDDTFARTIRGTEDPQLGRELAAVGLELRASHDPAQLADGLSAVWLGAQLVAGSGRVVGVLDDSPAHAAGLSPLDEIIAVDGFRVVGDADLRGLLGLRKAGDSATLSLFRRGRLLTLPVVVGASPPTRLEIVGATDVDAARAGRWAAWMGEPHPGAQVLATITTTARAL